MYCFLHGASLGGLHLDCYSTGNSTCFLSFRGAEGLLIGICLMGFASLRHRNSFGELAGQIGGSPGSPPAFSDTRPTLEARLWGRARTAPSLIARPRRRVRKQVDGTRLSGCCRHWAVRRRSQTPPLQLFHGGVRKRRSVGKGCQAAVGHGLLGVPGHPRPQPDSISCTSAISACRLVVQYGSRASR